ncbi:hypothetical protein I6A84_34180 [Frankia sp. CNm7]|uniref:Uncharacterized protein n=1 Tax=Frankia nepalensis TaxID=1836974 RepID=A0A937USF5_9ACTN|nr:hypothetical protein [Frankia nepalensis]MBL7500371.1 hypothetical protein [Frankia nepalensis]MBL7508669.1 hypothetical protein [Frankia nepalensis]MBL7522996.1 hypothetical protein [Frankia nepalensis]MBL7628831.1 hypothetical protein [Frankia nepalensis]
MSPPTPPGAARRGAADAVRRAAGRAGPVLDRLDDVAVPVAGQGLEVVVGAAAAASRVVTAHLLRLALRTRLISAPAAAAGGGEASEASNPAGAPSTGRAVLERGARIAVLGLVAMIMLSATAAMLPGLDGHPRRDHPPADPPAGLAPGGGAPETGAGGELPLVTIGPGQDGATADYLAAADLTLTGLAADAPTADLLAVVSLTGYREPLDLYSMLRLYRVTQVFFAVPGSGEVYQASIHDPEDVKTAFDARATAAAARAVSAVDAATQASSRAEADALRGYCACLFAAVVRAPAGRLVELRHDPTVRVVDVAPPGTYEHAARFIPVRPDQP